MRMYVSPMLMLVSVALISACGGSSPRPYRGQDSVTPNSFTGGDENGRAYTGYGPTPELDHVREQVSATTDNKEFADQIESATVLRHNGEPDNGDTLRISVKWRGLTKPLDFWGELNQKNGVYTGVLRDQTGQKKGFVLTVSCSSVDCATVVGYMYFDRILKAGMIFRLTDRLVQLAAKPADYQLTRCYSKDIQDGVDKYIQGVKVTVASTEIVPGRSSFKLYEGAPTKDTTNTLQGELLSTEGDCIPLKGTGEKAIFANICMAGNNSEGGLIFRTQLPPLPKDCKVPATSTQDPSLYLQLQNPTSGQTTTPGQTPPAAGTVTTPATPVTQNPAATQNPVPQAPTALCQLPVDAANANTLVLNLFKDCGNPEITNYMTSNWQVKGVRNGGLLRYLKAHRDSNQNNGSADGVDYTTMRNVLKSKGIPLFLSFITAQESAFNKKATGGKKEVGLWQILPSNAATSVLGRVTSSLTTADFAAIDAKIRPVAVNTGWAADLLKTAIASWTDATTKEVNLKMVLATYNYGIGNATRASQNASSRLQTAQKQGRPEVKELTIDDIRHFSEDFWVLAKAGMLGRADGVSRYVPSVLAAMFSGINPVAANVTTDASLSFLDLDQ